MAEPLVIETAGLCKRYGGRERGTDALRGLDLEVPAGSICGFLGRDGAGKTTTIKVLLGMPTPAGGAPGCSACRWATSRGRVISVVTGAGAEPILDEIYALGAVSIDVGSAPGASARCRCR